MKIKKKLIITVFMLYAVVFGLYGCSTQTKVSENSETYSIFETTAETVIVGKEAQQRAIHQQSGNEVAFDFSQVPEFAGQPYVEINGNQPFFTEDTFGKNQEYYSERDALGRCGMTYARVTRDLMPTEERGEIGMIRPSGWHTVKYDHIDGRYLYNRCHLIAYQLSGENANENNLITGTRYLNVKGMLPFENMVADYVEKTGNTVLYRVTPIFKGTDLVASGVLMEGWSLEDRGQAICFCVYCYNVQPGVRIHYADGESQLDQTALTEAVIDDTDQMLSGHSDVYVVNKNTKKFHLPECRSVDDIKPKNKMIFEGTEDALIAQGYQPCKRCLGATSKK